MAMKNATDVAMQWLRGMQNATQKITAGVDAVTEAPGKKAAAQKDKYLQGVQANVDKWAANTAAVSLAEWQKTMKDIGIPRVAQGAQAKTDRVEAFMQFFLPKVNAIQNQIKAMPSNTLEARKQRMLANFDAMSKIKYIRPIR